MRSSRLLSIVLQLQIRGTITAAELAAHFEVSRRTILRDVEQLSAAGIPVYTDRGCGGGIKLVDGYRTSLTGMTSSESDAIVFLGIPDIAAQLGIDVDLFSAQGKLLAALPADAAKSASTIASRFHVDPMPWYRRIDRPGHLVTVARAVWDGTAITIGYESWSTTRRHTVSPIGLVVKAGAWYLVANSRAKPRVYRLDKIGKVSASSARFVPAERNFKLGDFWDRWTTDFEARLRHQFATIKATPAGVAGLQALGAHLAEHMVVVDAADDTGRIVVRIPIESIGNAARDLILLGDAIEILTPTELRDAIAQRAASITAIYAPTCIHPDPPPVPRSKASL